MLDSSTQVKTIQELHTYDHEIHLHYKLIPAILKLDHQAKFPKRYSLWFMMGFFAPKWVEISEAGMNAINMLN